MTLPSEIVGETLPTSFGPVDTELTIQSFEREWTTVSYKQNVVHVEASGGGSKREGGVCGAVQFTVTENEWRRMNNVSNRSKR
jgi:hypothetical protein